MAKLNNKQLKNQASRLISENRGSPVRLILVYMLVLATLNLVYSGLSLYLDHQISNTGGLSGVGMRSILETLQTILYYFTAFFSPFWTAGLTCACIAIARGQESQPQHLLGGFKRGPRVLSFILIQSILSIMVMMACFYMAIYLYLFTPLSDGLVNALSGVTQADLVNMEAIAASIPTDVLLLSSACICGFFLLFLIPIFGYVSYSMRMGLYLVLEGGRISALGALFRSNQLMKGHRLQLFRLDLSYWWYYLLEGLIGVLAYLDVLLPMIGVRLPFDDTVAYFAALALSLVVQLGLYVWKKLEVETSYILAFESIAHPQEPTDTDI